MTWNRSPPPARVTRQRQAFIEEFGDKSIGVAANRREKMFAEFPEHHHILSSKTLVAINARSDTYHPLIADLLGALDGIWRQGIHPEKLKIYDWDHSTLLLELE